MQGIRCGAAGKWRLRRGATGTPMSCVLAAWSIIWSQSVFADDGDSEDTVDEEQVNADCDLAPTEYEIDCLFVANRIVVRHFAAIVNNGSGNACTNATVALRFRNANSPWNTLLETGEISTRMAGNESRWFRWDWGEEGTLFDVSVLFVDIFINGEDNRRGVRPFVNGPINCVVP